jgi:hypothetical protein
LTVLAITSAGAHSSHLPKSKDTSP